MFFCVGALASACTAQFSDLRPDESSGNDDVNGNGTSNGTGGDGGENPEVGCGFGIDEELSGGSLDVSDEEGTVLLTTSSDGLQGRSGYEAMGQVSLVELGDGSLELRFGEDFEVDNGPNLRVVISSRENLSGGISTDEGDLDLGAALTPPDASKPQGEQAFWSPKRDRSLQLCSRILRSFPSIIWSSRFDGALTLNEILTLDLSFDEALGLLQKLLRYEEETDR